MRGTIDHEAVELAQALAADAADRADTPSVLLFVILWQPERFGRGLLGLIRRSRNHCFWGRCFRGRERTAGI